MAAGRQSPALENSRSTPAEPSGRHESTVTCKDIHEQITAFVDDRIDEAEYREKVQQHLEYCPDCRSVYEMELLTKLAVQQHIHHVPTPDTLRRSIAGGVEQIESERLAEIEARRRHDLEQDWLDRFARQYLSPAGIGIALALVALGSILLFDPFASVDTLPVVEQTPGSHDADPSDPTIAANLFVRASENFSAIEKHQLDVQFHTSDPERLAGYFREHGVTYPVRFAPVSLPLAGGVVSSHGSTRLAHLIYLDGERIVYIFEVPAALLDRREIFYVSDDVLRRLHAGERIWEALTPERSTFVVRQEGVVLAVVANLDRPAVERLVSIQ